MQPHGGEGQRRMSDTEQTTIAIYKPRRRWRWLIGVAVAICVLAAFLRLMTWAARPRWYTYVSKPTSAPPHNVLVMRLPVGWQCQSSSNEPAAAVICLSMQPKPLSGFALWWNQHLLRLGNAPLTPQAYEISLIRSEEHTSELQSQ